MDTQEDSQLILSWQETQWVVGGHAPARAVIGREPSTDLPLDLPFASRTHAYLEQRQQSFVLVDHSTNGTYVQTEDEQVTLVHRGEMRLWGEGWLSLGEQPTATNVVHFSLSRPGVQES
jgi:adenylate cyclase